MKGMFFYSMKAPICCPKATFLLKSTNSMCFGRYSILGITPGMKRFTFAFFPFFGAIYLFTCKNLIGM